MKQFLITALVIFFTAVTTHGEVTIKPIGRTPTLHVDGTPMLIIGGELGNSSASSEPDIRKNLAKCARMNLNTVLVPVYWDLLEPEEGVFDYTLPDAVIREARANDLKVVLLWFGAWKNSMSCYAPEWIKNDWKRFPRAKTSTGKPLEILSAFNDNVFKADSTAFINLLHHLDRTDTDNTVLMIQIENEIGMLEDARDHSVAADSAFNEGVPLKLINQLNLPSHYKAGKLSWNEAFGGPSPEADEAFMAWHYAGYVGRLAEAAKKAIKRPLYVNAAMNSRGRKPGEYPSAGPLAHLKDIWKTGAPDVDIMAPDIYDSGFKGWVDQYALPDNPLFIPEIRHCDDNPAQALYAFGQHGAIGFSPFSIENGSDDPANRSVKGFKKLREWEPLLLKYRREGLSKGIYFDKDDKEISFSFPSNPKSEKPAETSYPLSEISAEVIDSLQITASHFFTLPWDPRATDGSEWPAGGAVIIRIAPMEYIIAGTGVVIKFEAINEMADKRTLGEDGFLATGVSKAETKSPSTANYSTTDKRIGILYCDEVDPALKRIRRLSGDETHQGRHVRISPDDFSILHVKLYSYR